MAAITALLLATCSAGDHVVCGDAVYGGTVRLLRNVLGRFGVDATFADPTDPDAVAGAIGERTRLVLVETPANPTLVLTDIAAVAARCGGVPLVVDNTFLTAALQRPLDLGAAATVYSTTKFVEGHNATIGGALVTRDGELLERVRSVRNTIGCPLAPFDAWLTIRGSTTLHLRMEAHSRNALAVAEFLEAHPAVRSVRHPDLASFPQRALAARQQRAGGGVLCFGLAGGVEAGERVLAALRLCSLAESLGAVETLVTHPASMTHAEVPPELRRRAGITDGLVRLSVGIEDPADVIADLAQALGRLA
jgi:cystathionine beta-lyase/cystathionine gamma-synthase